MTYDNQQPLISVIIPVYKVEQYLEKCLDSIMNNTYKNLEIICVNDGSPDNSLSILKRYSDLDPRFIVIDQVNQGVSAARNNGLKAAHGEYVTLIDSDDYVHRQYFKILLECMIAKKADIVVCNAFKVSPSDSVDEEHYRHIHFQKLDSRAFFKNYYARHMVWGRLYKRESLQGHAFVSEVKISDDTLFNLEVVKTMDDPLVYWTDLPLYYYLQRDDSFVHTWNFRGLKDISLYYLKNHAGNRDSKGGIWGWMLTMQVIKSTLSYRLLIQDDPDHKALKRESNKTLLTCLKDMMTYKDLPASEKAIHWIMYCCPPLYKAFRLYTDPSMRR